MTGVWTTQPRLSRGYRKCPSIEPSQGEEQAAVGMFLSNQLVGAGRQRQPPFKTAMRQFNAVHPRRTFQPGPAPRSAHGQFPMTYDDFHFVAFDAGECHDN